MRAHIGVSQSEVSRAVVLELVASEHITVCFSTSAPQKPSEGSGVRFKGGSVGSPRLSAKVLAETPQVQDRGDSSGTSLHLSEGGPGASA